MEFGLAPVDEPPRLYVGAFPVDADDVAVLSELGIQTVVNLCQDSEYPAGSRAVVEAAIRDAGIAEQRVEFVDFGRFESARLEAAVGEVLLALQGGRRVYLHCRAGQQRASAVAAGALALRDRLSLDQALEEIWESKPGARPLDPQLEDLRAWYKRRRKARRSGADREDRTCQDGKGVPAHRGGPSVGGPNR